MEEKNTKQAKFWVANAMEAGDGGVVHRYWFTIDLSDAEFEELYQLWYNNNCELNSWDTDDKGHEALFEKLNPSLIPDNYFQQFLGVFVGLTVCLSAKAS